MPWSSSRKRAPAGSMNLNLAGARDSHTTTGIIMGQEIKPCRSLPSRLTRLPSGALEPQQITVNDADPIRSLHPAVAPAATSTTLPWGRPTMASHGIEPCNERAPTCVLAWRRASVEGPAPSGFPPAPDSAPLPRRARPPYARAPVPSTGRRKGAGGLPRGALGVVVRLGYGAGTGSGKPAKPTQIRRFPASASAHIGGLA